jgi:hypothetical protein
MSQALLAVPAYFHPDVETADWVALTDPALLDGSPFDGVRFVVLNVANGPDTWRQGPFVRAIDGLHRAGVPVIGYLDTGYGRRPVATVLAEAARYREWYGVEGAFLDQVRSDPDGLEHTAAITAGLRAAPLLVLNHGTHPDEAYAGLADILVTFEGPATAHRALTVPDWVWAYPRARFCHLVYGCRPQDTPAVVERAVRSHAGTIYVTDRVGANPWDGLPAWLTAGITLARPGGSDR